MRRLANALLVAGAATLFVASAIHSGVIGSFDVFPAAAVPEAVIGGVLAVGTIVSVVWRSGVVAIVVTAFAIAGTLFGLGFTVPRGEIGDVAYHVGLLATLIVAAALPVRTRPERT